ncbi:MULTISPECIES: hypothetical protein [Bizionia]|uniref:Uncharacterized protein n=1 Tax=Bizionia algoritergicola TaxID=291187 RepID=A0A5D0R0Y4_9FLAO|nr:MULTISPECIES: hypothetical protein [Bizionia]OBX23089.1 hypothetical protein BAA08_06010 [Bizionia sp. APA-3]TYB74749.1 hypothetical protein ES675_01025 [Bizionia algoritergicola]
MKTLKITLVAAIFCLTLTGLTIQKETTNPNNEEQVSQKEDFTYAFQTKRHVKKGTKVPSNG